MIRGRRGRVILVAAAATEKEPRGAGRRRGGVGRGDHRASALQEPAEGRDARAGADHDHRVGHVGRGCEVRGFLDVERNPEGLVRRSSIQPVGRDAPTGRAEGVENSTTENATAGTPPCASGAEVMLYILGWRGWSASRSSAQPGAHDGCDSRRSRSVGHSSPHRTLYSSRPPREHSVSKSRRSPASVHASARTLRRDLRGGAVTSTAWVSAAPTEAGHRMCRRGGAEVGPDGRLTFRPAQLEHGVWVEAESRGERVHQRGVVLGARPANRRVQSRDPSRRACQTRREAPFGRILGRS